MKSSRNPKKRTLSTGTVRAGVCLCPDCDIPLVAYVISYISVPIVKCLSCGFEDYL